MSSLPVDPRKMKRIFGTADWLVDTTWLQNHSIVPVNGIASLIAVPHYPLSLSLLRQIFQFFSLPPPPSLRSSFAMVTADASKRFFKTDDSESLPWD